MVGNGLARESPANRAGQLKGGPQEAGGNSSGLLTEVIWELMHSSYIKEAKATFRTSVKVIRERMELKEREISGEWMTEERMQKSGDYSKQLCSASLLTKNPKPRNLKLRNPKALNYTLNPKRCVCVCSAVVQRYLVNSKLHGIRMEIKSILAYCSKFPEALCRHLECMHSSYSSGMCLVSLKSS